MNRMRITSKKIQDLGGKAMRVRRATLEMIASSGKGHIGGAFSATDILVTLYYGGVLRFDSSRPRWDGRDRFILSKGHAVAALYVILSDLGFFPSSELARYQAEGCILGGHPTRRVPGVEADTGSLGHGLAIGAGLALSARIDRKDFSTVVLVGDGECHEGEVWEAAMFAGHHRLKNLTVVVDKNDLCSTDFLRDCVGIEPLSDKWKAFGWDVTAVNGHSFRELLSAFRNLRTRVSPRPRAIIANTVKGRGVSFMEGQVRWHHSVPQGEELETARKELSRRGPAY